MKPWIGWFCAFFILFVANTLRGKSTAWIHKYGNHVPSVSAFFAAVCATAMWGIFY